MEIELRCPRCGEIMHYILNAPWTGQCVTICPKCGSKFLHQLNPYNSVTFTIDHQEINYE